MTRHVRPPRGGRTSVAGRGRVARLECQPEFLDEAEVGGVKRADDLAAELHRQSVLVAHLLDTSTNALARLEHRHVGAGGREVARGGETGEAGPQHEDVCHAVRAPGGSRRQQLARARPVEQVQVVHRVDTVGVAPSRTPRRPLDRRRDRAVPAPSSAGDESVEPRAVTTVDERPQLVVGAEARPDLVPEDSLLGDRHVHVDARRAARARASRRRWRVRRARRRRADRADFRRRRTRSAAAPGASRSSSGRAPSTRPPPPPRSPCAGRAPLRARRRGTQPLGSRYRGRVTGCRRHGCILTHSWGRRYPD